MKHTYLRTLSLFTAMVLFTACNSKIPFVETDTTDECSTINKKLAQIDKFTKVVNETSAFHLEESAVAIPTPGITVSNNKSKMLKDAKTKKAALSTEHQKLGCETPKQ